MRPLSADPDVAKKVRKAIVSGDVAALSTWGARGAEKTNELKANKAAANEYFKEKEAASDQALRESTNEHILPADPEQQ